MGLRWIESWSEQKLEPLALQRRKTELSKVNSYLGNSLTIISIVRIIISHVTRCVAFVLGLNLKLGG